MSSGRTVIIRDIHELTYVYRYGYRHEVTLLRDDVPVEYTRFYTLKEARLYAKHYLDGEIWFF